MDGFITTAEAAKLLGVTPRYVRRLAAEGRIKAELVGRDYLLDEKAVARFKPAPRGRPTAK